MTTGILQQNKDGSWSKAKPLPYYPNIWEYIGHWFGIHQWTYVKPYQCVICGKMKDTNDAINR